MVALDRLPTPSQMKAYLDRHVAGQERAKRSLAAAVYRHYLGLAYRELPASEDRDFGRQHVLLFGPTGCGKTYLVRTLARRLGVPVAFAAATQLVEAGYVGEQVDSIFVSLYAAAGNDVARAERGIVFLDEFDKVRRVRGNGRDVSGEGVQNALLAMLDGSPVRVRQRNEAIATIDSSRVLFVCTGAFAGLADLVRARLARRDHAGGLGFGAILAGRGALHDRDALAHVTTDDLVEYGFIPELVGRFAAVAALEPLGRDDLVRILSGVEDGPLEREKRQFSLHGIELEVTPGACDALAARAVTLGTGARGLPRLLHEVLEPVAWRLPELAARGVGRVRVGDEALAAGGKPLLLAPRPGQRPAFPAAEQLREGALAPLPAARRADRRLLERLRELDDGEAAVRATQLQAMLGFDRLAAEARAAWERYRDTVPPPQLVWTLERLKHEGVDLATFVEALCRADSAEPNAVMHYACYLRAKAAAEAARRRREERPRRPRRHGTGTPDTDPDVPLLDL
jgi:ATP-dependent Clp protease ATP-binding subunit ClpX